MIRIKEPVTVHARVQVGEAPSDLDFTAALKRPYGAAPSELGAGLAEMAIAVSGLNTRPEGGLDKIRPTIISLNDEPCHLPVLDATDLAKAIAEALTDLE